MLLEITTGILFGSMALLADGVHMGSHALALGIAAFAYYYTRKNAHDRRFSFGTGKVNSLGGFSSALLLIVFAISLSWESIERLFKPVEIQFNQAIIVATAGLIVNLVSAWILSRSSTNMYSHGEHNDHHFHSHQDHNLKAAYLHVIADALTSVFALIALFAGKLWGLVWMDPLMGILGAIMVSKWAMGLLKQTSGILLDRQAPEEIQTEVKSILEQNGDRIADMHIWQIGEGLYSLNISLVTHSPMPSIYYKKMLSEHKEFVHVMVEVHKCNMPVSN